MKEVNVGTHQVRAIWTNEMSEDLKKQTSSLVDFEKHLVSVLKAEKRKSKINKIIKNAN